MYPFDANLHILQADAGEDQAEVLDHYPPLLQSQTPGHYYQPVSWEIRRCIHFSDRWRTLSQWQPVRGQLLDGMGTN